MAYPTLTDLKTRLKITDATADTDLGLLLAGAISQVEQFVGRNFSGINRVVVDEEYDIEAITQSSNNFIIQLRQMGVTAVTAVKLGNVAIASDEYLFNKEGRIVVRGRLFDIASGSFNDYQYIKVSYTHNEATPADVFNTILAMAITEWNNLLTARSGSAAVGSSSTASSGSISSEKIGDYSVNYGGKSGTNESVGSMRSMLNHYRKRRV